MRRSVVLVAVLAWGGLAQASEFIGIHYLAAAQVRDMEPAMFANPDSFLRKVQAFETRAECEAGMARAVNQLEAMGGELRAQTIEMLRPFNSPTRVINYQFVGHCLQRGAGDVYEAVWNGRSPTY
ncbi:MAG: hypothetical protein R3280_06925 [Marinobacter sp.]|uniref:hypothetical protein n=1 Tax=Marinobacter sp. TaxID=50741 RepID=UPI00299D9A60|nr:hypothetical protein [Marinobacter sp.]MDX1634348.1 hypothetical protein [Marinobacter sp.]